jgi:hypothetical protein
VIRGVGPTESGSPVTAYTLELDGTKDFGPCECCGHDSRKVWGFVYRDGDAHAIYYVEWTLGGVAQHGAYFDIVLGEFGGASRVSDRTAVSLEFRHTDKGPGFMLIDASSRPIASNSLVGKAMSREQALDTPISVEAFNIVDAIWLQDPRIAEIAGGPTIG